jgi:hypothetical protein
MQSKSKRQSERRGRQVGTEVPSRDQQKKPDAPNASGSVRMAGERGGSRPVYLLIRRRGGRPPIAVPWERVRLSDSLVVTRPGALPDEFDPASE